MNNVVLMGIKKIGKFLNYLGDIINIICLYELFEWKVNFYIINRVYRKWCKFGENVISMLFVLKNFIKNYKSKIGDNIEFYNLKYDLWISSIDIFIGVGKYER